MQRQCIQKLDEPNQSVWKLGAAGFSLIEVLFAIGIFAVLLLIIVNGFQNYAYRQVHQSFADEVLHSVSEQQQKSIAAEANLPHGVYVGTTSIVLFAGSAYVPGAPDNETILIPGGTIATSSFTGSIWSVWFDRITGTPSATGTITIFNSRAAATSTVTLLESGLIEYE